jgi:alkanesulfonate monooxygenase SsuD/methylene tetrahydromethanopterin reductase-like flavin-dependent oxidoreductase (luciferase family)
LDGQEVRVRDYVGLPVPAARPHLSLMIGGSKKRVLSIAACEGDIVSLSNVIASGVDTVAEIETQVGYVRDAAGERFDELDIELMPLCVEITDDPDSALERLSPMFGVEPEFLRDHPLVLVGSLDHLVDELEKRRAVFGVNYVTIPQYFVDAFAPVVSCLTGR